ncbi:MAG: hypothetical protein K6G68_05975 [Oscillospiraceae bacterium]|nr:hypothetical protein [Oscillospiraceae bacterium]
MPVIIPNISAPIGATEPEICSAALKKIRAYPSDVKEIHIHKVSVDARKRDNIHLVCSVWAEFADMKRELQLSGKKLCAYTPSEPYIPPRCTRKDMGRTVVAGFGPAGMFAALLLAESGVPVTVLERGGTAEERASAIDAYKQGGHLDESSNVQFGEGGAGTFSDGKLTTRIKDIRCRYILERFVEFGAPREILYKAKPHIGTDNLVKIVRNIRERIIEAGGEVRFHSQVTDIDISGGAVKSVTINKSEVLPASGIILAIGHSARDTFEMLCSKQVPMQAKAFAIGARIEHTQAEIDRSLYGEYAGDPLLPVGEYNLSLTKDRGVYTFCMCPGGVVTASANENGTIVTNGMSEFARDGKNANSAVVVSVSPDDFGREILDGVKFAESIEKKAFTAGGGYAPACTVGSFMEKKGSLENAAVEPTYLPGVRETRFDDIFPSFITDTMRIGLADFARKMKAFGNMGAVLTAPETRTSSPVRIIRGENMQSDGIEGLYPCGEGAGYAGGIMSAATDGLRQAEAVLAKYS